MLKFRPLNPAPPQSNPTPNSQQPQSQIHDLNTAIKTHDIHALDRILKSRPPKRKKNNTTTVQSQEIKQAKRIRAAALRVRVKWMGESEESEQSEEDEDEEEEEEEREKEKNKKSAENEQGKEEPISLPRNQQEKYIEIDDEPTREHFKPNEESGQHLQVDDVIEIDSVQPTGNSDVVMLEHRSDHALTANSLSNGVQRAGNQGPARTVDDKTHGDVVLSITDDSLSGQPVTKPINQPPISSEDYISLDIVNDGAVTDAVMHHSEVNMNSANSELQQTERQIKRLKANNIRKIQMLSEVIEIEEELYKEERKAEENANRGGNNGKRLARHTLRSRGREEAWWMLGLELATQAGVAGNKGLNVDNQSKDTPEDAEEILALKKAAAYVLQTCLSLIQEPNILLKTVFRLLIKILDINLVALVQVTRKIPITSSVYSEAVQIAKQTIARLKDMHCYTDLRTLNVPFVPTSAPLEPSRVKPLIHHQSRALLPVACQTLSVPKYLPEIGIRIWKALIQARNAVLEVGDQNIPYKIFIDPGSEDLEFIKLDLAEDPPEEKSSQRIIRPSRASQSVSALPQVFEDMPKTDLADSSKPKRTRYQWIPSRLVATSDTSGASDSCMGNWDGMKNLDEWLVHYVKVSLETWTRVNWGGVSDTLVNSCMDLGVSAIRSYGVKMYLAFAELYMDAMCTPSLHTINIEKFLLNFDVSCLDQKWRNCDNKWQQGFDQIFQLLLYDLRSEDARSQLDASDQIRILLLNLKFRMITAYEPEALLTHLIGLELALLKSTPSISSLLLPNCRSLNYIDHSIIKSLKDEIEVSNEIEVMRNALEQKDYNLIITRNQFRLEILKTPAIRIFSEAAMSLQRLDLYWKSLAHRFIKDWNDLTESEISTDTMADALDTVAAEMVHSVRAATSFASCLNKIPPKLSTLLVTSIQAAVKVALNYKIGSIWLWCLGFWTIEQTSPRDSKVTHQYQYLMHIHELYIDQCCRDQGIFLMISLDFFEKHTYSKEADQCIHCLWGITFSSMDGINDHHQPSLPLPAERAPLIFRRIQFEAKSATKNGSYTGGSGNATRLRSSMDNIEDSMQLSQKLENPKFTFNRQRIAKYFKSNLLEEGVLNLRPSKHELILRNLNSKDLGDLNDVLVEFFALKASIWFSQIRAKHYRDNNLDDINELIELCEVNVALQHTNAESWKILADSSTLLLENALESDVGELIQHRKYILRLQKTIILSLIQNYNMEAKHAKKPWDELHNILWLTQTKPFQGALFASANHIKQDLFRTAQKSGTNINQREQIYRLCERLGRIAVSSLAEEKAGLYVYYYDLARVTAKDPRKITDAISLYLQSIKLSPELKCYQGTREESVIDPYYKLATLLAKSYFAGKITAETLLSTLSGTGKVPIKDDCAEVELADDRVYSAEDVKDYLVRFYDWMLEADKANWHHKPIYRKAWLLFHHCASPNEALNTMELIISFRNSGRARFWTQWITGLEEAGKHHAYRAKYALFLLSIFHNMKDLSSLWPFVRRLYKHAPALMYERDIMQVVNNICNELLPAEFKHSLDRNETKTWTDIITKYSSESEFFVALRKSKKQASDVLKKE